MLCPHPLRFALTPTGCSIGSPADTARPAASTCRRFTVAAARIWLLLAAISGLWGERLPAAAAQDTARSQTSRLPEPTPADSSVSIAAGATGFQAGAATVDITPMELPRIIAGGFLEGRADQVTDRLFVRAFVLDDGSTALALVVVDTCMLPQTLIDQAKQLASQQCGLPLDKMMVSATHTHSAPAAMSCLGTRQDVAYAATLPAKIAEAIVTAHGRLAPAEIGWASIDDWEHTHNRRWVRKPERMVVDPFGQVSGRAHMHPGYQSADVVGPSGPVDPALSVIAMRHRDGRPLGILANYSQHYFGSPPVSADYYGHFCRHLAELLDQPGEGNGPLVCAMSQGTSGDLMWMDYGSPAKSITVERYAQAVAMYAEAALDRVVYHESVSLAMVEKSLTLRYRVPDESRLAWATPIAAQIEDDRPRNLPEVYAQEALILHERQQTEIKLQAIRIGDLTIATLPNEVYALTGLKLRGRAPLTAHFNIELANGAEGYIPPPEQHALGGYTTWPARTAGLEVDAEPKIVERLLEALEEVSQTPRRQIADTAGPYATAVLDAQPIGYWRLNDADGWTARNMIAGGPIAQLQPGFAWFLPGVGSGSGIGVGEQLVAGPFSGPGQINRAVHLAGGQLDIDARLPQPDCTLCLWFWLGEPSGASERSGTLCTLPVGASLAVHQDANHQFRLEWHGTFTDQRWPADQWHFLTLVRSGDQTAIYLNGDEQPVLSGPSLPAGRAPHASDSWTIGRQLEGKVDELALFDRCLEPATIAKLWELSGIPEQRAIETGRRQQAAERVAARVSAPRLSQPEAVRLHASAPPRVPPSNGDSSSAGQTAAGEPLTAREAVRQLVVPPGFRVELVAAEPLVIDPVAFDWDPDGRLWVVEMADYPLGIDGQGEPGGRVRVLEDRDGDGFYETSRLFADKLNFPNGIVTWRGGAIVTAAPHILWLRDTSGDGVADVREILLEGFLEGNQQLRVNGLRWGLDGWLYCASGGHHANYGTATTIRSPRLGKDVVIGSHDFRFRPDTGEVEIESGPSQFGRNRNAWGDWFGTQNANPLWHYVIPERYLARNPHVPLARPIQYVLPAGSPPVYPASGLEKRFHNFHEAGHFTSACGSTIYEDEVLFGVTHSQHAFVCEPFHNLVQYNRLIDRSTSYLARRPVGHGGFDFFASPDRWSRPVMARTGPDGALWIADMVRYMIEHPDWLPPEGKAELLPHYRLGDKHGRIYRVLPDSPRGDRPWAFPNRETHTLLAALDSANSWQRDMAQQLLVEAADPAAASLIAPLVTQATRAEVRLQALHTLGGLGQLAAEQLVPALRDPHPLVRRGALQLCEQFAEQRLLEAMVNLRHDAHPKVRLQLALSLGQFSGPLAASALVQLACDHSDEPFMATAIVSAWPRHHRYLTAAILDEASPAVLELYYEPMLRWTLSGGGVGGAAAEDDPAGHDRPSSVVALVERSLSAAADGQWATLERLLVTLNRLGKPLAELTGSLSSTERPAVERRLEAAFAACLEVARSADRPVSERVAAARVLCFCERYAEQGSELLTEWLGPEHEPRLQHQVLEVLQQSGTANVPKLLAARADQLTPALRRRAVDVWMSRAVWASSLLEALEAGTLPRSSLDPDQQAALRRYPDAAVAQQTERVLGSLSQSPRQGIVQAYLRTIDDSANTVPDRARGGALYARHCASCHRRGDNGYEVGPNLATVVSHSTEKLLTHILDPNIDIQPGYQAYICLLDDDQILSGLLVAESAGSITLSMANGITRVIPRSEIRQLKNTNVSLMPEGLEGSISHQEMADLIAYLQGPVAESTSN